MYIIQLINIYYIKCMEDLLQIITIFGNGH